MRSRIIATFICVVASYMASMADTIPSGFSMAPEWRVGAEVSPAWVPQTNSFLEGFNPRDKRISGSISGTFRADFSFSPYTREGMLYHGLYQGIGVGVNSFFSHELLGTPVSAYVYQGAPIATFGNRLWLGYEWQFGAASGWHHFDEESAVTNAAVSTAVTAHMGLALKLHYALSGRWRMSLGIVANHYSNGNTSLPNAGVNSIGATIGMAYVINPSGSAATVSRELEEEADRHSWFYDVTAFGAWRRRIVNLGDPSEPRLCPGKFAVAGIQFAPAYRLDRRVAVGPALDIQWDESSGLEPYWVDGTSDEDIKFVRPPFGRQLSVGLSAHAELTMPIFAVNAGLGYDVVNPRGDKRFYQSLTLKTFVTRRVFLNVGYRLGSFKEPQNLMLGVGVRL